MAEILEKLTEEEIQIAESLFYPPALAECLFSDFTNWSEFHDTKFANLRLYQYPMLSWEAFYDFEHQGLSAQQKFDLRKGASDCYCIGGRLIGKSGIFQILDLLQRIFYSLWYGAEDVGFSAFIYPRIQKILDKVSSAVKRHPFFHDIFQCSSSRSSPYKIVANTGFEINSINMNTKGKCFDTETEILTDNGWKNYQTISKNDKALSLDIVSNKADFHKIDKIYNFDYNGDIYNFYLRDKVIGSFTPEHNILYKWSGHKNWFKKQIKKFNLSKNTVIDLNHNFKWSGHERNKDFIFNYRENNKYWKDLNIKTDDFIEFLGWFIAEGHLVKGKNSSYKIGISQHKNVHPEECVEIENLLSRMGVRFYNVGNKCYYFSSKDIFEYLKNNCYSINENSRIRKKSVYCCYNKKVPDFIKELSSRQINIFLNAFRKGDGHTHIKKNKTVTFYNTSSKQLADDLQDLILKTGLSASIFYDKDKNYVVNVLNSKNRSIMMRNIKKEHYNGIVWCVTVNPNNLILIRKNGVTYWTGNSPGENFYGEHFKILYIEECSLETEAVYKARKNSVDELGCIFRSSGMTNFRKTSPIGQIIKNPENKKFVVNLPQKINPSYTVADDLSQINDMGGKASENYRMFVDGDIIEDRQSVFDMEFIRDYLIDDEREVITAEIDKDNYALFRTILNIVKRPKNANRIFIGSDIGRGKGIGSTEIAIFSEIKTDGLPIYKYLYNITLAGLFDDDMQKEIFQYLIEQLQCEMCAFDTGEGTGLAIHTALSKIYPQNLYAYYGNKKIKIGYQVDEDGNILKHNGDIVYIEEFAAEFSVKRLQQLFYKQRMDLPYCPKFEKQFDQITPIFGANRTLYRCAQKNDHLFDAFKVFAIAQHEWEFKNLEKPTEKKPNIAFA